MIATLYWVRNERNCCTTDGGPSNAAGAVEDLRNDTERAMPEPNMTDAQWRAEREFKRDEAERKRAAATDPKEERRWRAARDNYKRQLTMGRRRLSEATTKAAEKRR
jgi:hypothetical protein